MSERDKEQQQGFRAYAAQLPAEIRDFLTSAMADLVACHSDMDEQTVEMATTAAYNKVGWRNRLALTICANKILAEQKKNNPAEQTPTEAISVKSTMPQEDNGRFLSSLSLPASSSSKCTTSTLNAVKIEPVDDAVKKIRTRTKKQRVEVVTLDDSDDEESNSTFAYFRSSVTPIVVNASKAKKDRSGNRIDGRQMAGRDSWERSELTSASSSPSNSISSSVAVAGGEEEETVVTAMEDEVVPTPRQQQQRKPKRKRQRSVEKESDDDNDDDYVVVSSGDESDRTNAYTTSSATGLVRPCRRKTPEQLAELKKSFAADSRPSREQKEALATDIGLSFKEIDTWFRNQRALAKKSRPFRLCRKQKQQRRLYKTAEQVFLLRVSFAVNARPSAEEMAALERDIGLDVLRIERWFLNERYRLRLSGATSTMDGEDTALTTPRTETKQQQQTREISPVSSLSNDRSSVSPSLLLDAPLLLPAAIVDVDFEGSITGDGHCSSKYGQTLADVKQILADETIDPFRLQTANPHPTSNLLLLENVDEEGRRDTFDQDLRVKMESPSSD